MSPDTVNGMFELLGAVFLVANCVRLYRDKQIKGVSPLPIVFFAVWGLWNLYFYPSVGAMWSFWGGIAVVTVNAFWLGQLAYYQWPLGRAEGEGCLVTC